MLLTSTVTPAHLRVACGQDPSWVCHHALTLTGNETVASITAWIVGAPLRILCIVIGAFVLERICRRYVRRALHGLYPGHVVGAIAHLAVREQETEHQIAHQRAEQRIDALASVLRSVITVVIAVLATFMVLGQVGINLAPLVAGVSVVGVAVGLGAQSLVKDCLNGAFILIEDQFGLGDMVDVGAASGTVEAISLRTTRLRSMDGIVWHVPNSQIKYVGNKSKHWSRALLDIEVAYDTDLTLAKRIIKRTLDAAWHDDPAILEEPDVWGVQDLGASGISIRLVVKTKPSEQFRISRMLRERLKVALDDAGIEIPFPTQTVWHRYEDGYPAMMPGAS